MSILTSLCDLQKTLGNPRKIVFGFILVSVLFVISFRCNWRDVATFGLVLTVIIQQFQ